MLRRVLTKSTQEKGFTLIELLVVMIVIALLAAIAVPIFMNQQKTAKDTAVVQDVRNAAIAVQTLLVNNPSTTTFSIAAAATPAPTVTMISSPYALLSAAPLASNALLASTTTTSAGNAVVTVGTQTAPVRITKGVTIAVKASGSPGGFYIYGWHTQSKTYATKALVYDNSNGGLQKTLADIPTDVTGVTGGDTLSEGSDTPVTPTPTPTTPAGPSYSVSGPFQVSVDTSVVGQYKYTVTWTPITGSFTTYGVGYGSYNSSGTKVYGAVETPTKSAVCTSTKCTYTMVTVDKSKPAYATFTVEAVGVTGTKTTSTVTFTN